MQTNPSPYDAPVDAESRLLAAGVVLHKGGDLSLQLSYRNRLLPWERKHITEWAALRMIAPAELVRRIKDPKGCWPATALVAGPARAALYELRRDGCNGKPLAEHLRDLGIVEQTLLQRLSAPQRWTREQALTMRNNAPGAGAALASAGSVQRDKKDRRLRLLSFDGVTDTLKGHCARLGASYHTILSRTRGRTVRGAYYPAMTVFQALRLGASRKERCDKGAKRQGYKRRLTARLLGLGS